VLVSGPAGVDATSGLPDARRVRLRAPMESAVQLCSNLSLMFTERPLAQRFAAARDAGFATVEIQFPDEHDLEELVRVRDEAGIPVTLINVPRGRGDEVGLGALPGREADFDAAVTTCLRYAQGLGVRKVNVLAGRPGDADPQACQDTLTRNLRLAGARFAAIGVQVMVEPVNPVDMPGFFLGHLAAGMQAVEAAGHSNVFLQFDLYHMAITEPDLPVAIRHAGARIGHVQFADTPGRHEPGTGRIDFAAALNALRAVGYDDVVSAEYRPAARTENGLHWIKTFRDWMT